MKTYILIGSMFLLAAFRLVQYKGDGVPIGMVVIIESGTCPTGYTEVSNFNNVFLRGTLAANSNIGTTGGGDSITPAGTITAPTFTGTASQATSSESAHTHSVTSNVTASTTSKTTTGSGTTLVTGLTNNAVTSGAGSSHSHTITPSGTISAPTFTGTAFDNKPAYRNVIFCKRT